MREQKMWRVITFAGWFLTFIGTGFLLIFLVSLIPNPAFAGAVLTLCGLALALFGEAMLSQHMDKVHRFVWEAFSVGGIFCLSVGLLWLVMRSVAMHSFLGLIPIILIGVVLILIGETRIVSIGETKKTRKIGTRKKIKRTGRGK